MVLGRARTWLVAVTVSATTLTGCSLNLAQPKPRDPNAVDTQLQDAKTLLDGVGRAQRTLLTDIDFGLEWAVGEAKGFKIYNIEPLTSLFDCIDGIAPPADPTAPTSTHAEPPAAPSRKGLLGSGVSSIYRLDNSAYVMSVSVETADNAASAELDKVLGAGGTMAACMGARLGSNPKVTAVASAEPHVVHHTINVTAELRGEPFELNAAIATVQVGTSYAVLLDVRPATMEKPNPTELIKATLTRVVAAQAELTLSTAPTTPVDATTTSGAPG